MKLKTWLTKRNLVLSLLTIIILIQLIPSSGLEKHLIEVGQDPWSIKKRLYLSKQLFNSGQAGLAKKEIDKIESSWILKLVLNLRPSLKKQLQQTKSFVYQPEKIKTEISYWQKVLENKPGYLDAFLRLAVLNYQLKNYLQAENYLKQAQQLDPNGLQVNKLAEIIKKNN